MSVKKCLAFRKKSGIGFFFEKVKDNENSTIFEEKTDTEPLSEKLSCNITV